MPKRATTKLPNAKWAVDGLPHTDYAPWIGRENWWTWELVALVSDPYAQPPRTPPHPLAQAYHDAPKSKGQAYTKGNDPDSLQACDYLEERLRDAFARNDTSIQVVAESELRQDGHRLIRAVDALRFVESHMYAINDKIVEDRRCFIEKLQVQKADVLARGGGRAGKYVREIMWLQKQDRPQLLFIPDELKPLLDTPQNETHASEEVHSVCHDADDAKTQNVPREWSDIMFRETGKREECLVWMCTGAKPERKVSPFELGLTNRNGKLKQAQWELFKRFIEGRGVLTGEIKAYKVRRLKDSLKATFEIPDDPIPFDANAGGYKAKFHVGEPAREWKLPTVPYEDYHERESEDECE